MRFAGDVRGMPEENALCAACIGETTEFQARYTGDGWIQ